MPKRTKPIIPPAPTAPGGEVKPMPHADSPVVLADSAEFRAESGGEWRCSDDGQMNNGKRCTTCGKAKE